MNEVILSLAAKHSHEVNSPKDRASLLRHIESLTQSDLLKKSAAHTAAAIEISEEAQKTLFRLPITQSLCANK